MSRAFSEQIDDYKDSIFALIGFANLFRFDDDTKSMNKNIKIFQGRKMKTSSKNRISPDTEVTPDLCIQGPDEKGVVGEVKKSFPEDKTLWMDDFKQLMSYDDDLSNWLTTSGTIDDHEIVLLPEQSRSRAVKKYFEDNNGKEITFNKNFIIVEFNRNDQAKPFFFFRKEYGGLKYFAKVDKTLDEGIQVPMLKLMPHYEKIKLYDSKPPLPYLLHLIWESVIMFKASDDEKFQRLRKNGKLPIVVTVREIVDILYEDYSFKKLNADNSSHQPKIPLTSWIKEAIDALVIFKLAECNNQQSGEYTVYFKKFKDALQAFIDMCNENKLGIEPLEKQMEMFKETEKKEEE